MFKRKEEKRKLGCLVEHWPGRVSLGSVLVRHQPKFTLSYYQIFRKFAKAYLQPELFQRIMINVLNVFSLNFNDK